jgi:Zn-dependent protease/CBS domain-containing protein
MSEQTSGTPHPRATRRVQTGIFAGIRLGSVLGFEISLDYSWFIIFFLILVTFTGAVFPAHVPDLDQLEYLIMGLAGTLLFFGSLLVHELSHAVVARRKGIEVEGITLFVFGGMARTSREPDTPGDEFLIAGVGPLASFVLAALFYAIAAVSPRLGLGLEVTVVAEYMGFLNLVLAIFNLFPGFPLDGGRLLRAVLWKLTGSLRRATLAATTAGRALGWGIIGLGLFALLVGQAFVGGLWFIFIGWFLNHAARMSYQHVLLQEVLSPLTVRQAMTPDPETVPPDIPLDTLVNEYFLRRPYNSFPVTGSDGSVLGLVTLSQVKEVPRGEWSSHSTRKVMSPVEEGLLAGPDESMISILDRMRTGEHRRILVVRNGELLGIISATDVARWLDRVSLMEE